MAFKIGFSVSEEKMTAPEPPDVAEEREPRRSVVRVQFPQRNMTLAYYNDRFDLHCGDLVYVDGKLEGKRGRVVDVNYNFRINLADYKRVIGVADTNVSGRFTLAGSHVLTFDRAALPRRKVMSWYKAPSKPDTEYACGSDDSTFPLRELHRMRVGVAVAERGYAYYAENRVRYLCLDGMKGYALVEGTEPYDVEFVYSDGMIYALTCSCYCVGNCKHEVAAMLQLREMLDRIEENYAGEYAAAGYFCPLLLTTKRPARSRWSPARQMSRTSMQNSMAAMRSGTIPIGETEAELRVGECPGADDGGRADREKR